METVFYILCNNSVIRLKANPAHLPFNTILSIRYLTRMTGGDMSTADHPLETQDLYSSSNNQCLTYNIILLDKLLTNYVCIVASFT